MQPAFGVTVVSYVTVGIDAVRSRCSAREYSGSLRVEQKYEMLRLAHSEMSEQSEDFIEFAFDPFLSTAQELLGGDSDLSR